MSSIPHADNTADKGSHSLSRESLIVLLKLVIQYACYAYMSEPPPNTVFQHYRRVIVGGKYQVPVVIFREADPACRKLVISIQGTDISQHRHVYLDSKLAAASWHGAAVHDAAVRSICDDIMLELKRTPELFNGITSVEVIGHSLGGYLAQRCSMSGRLHQYNRRVRCWAVDSPGLVPTDLAGLPAHEKQALKARHFAIMCWPNAVNTLGSHECSTLIHAAPRPTHINPVFMCDHHSSKGADTAARVTEFVGFFSKRASVVVDQVAQGYLKIGTMAVALKAFYERVSSHMMGVIDKAIEVGDIYHMHSWPQMNPCDIFEEVIKSMFSEPLTYGYIKKFFFKPEEFDIYSFLAAFCTKMEGYKRCDCNHSTHLYAVLLTD